MNPDDSGLPARDRKRAAKVTNERVKLLATALNSLSIGVAIASLIVPGVTSPSSLLELQRVIWILFALGLHISAQAILGLMRSEE